MKAEQSRAVAAAGLLILVGYSHPGMASGFLNDIQSASSASVSTAGQTAIAEDASTVYYNAAGMTLLDRAELVQAAGLIFPTSRFSNGATTDILGNPVLGSTAIKDQVSLLPSMFAVAPVSDRLRLGLGFFVPFGQAYKYDEGWVGRYQLQNISLKTVDIDPTIAYRMNDVFSVGVGLDVQYAHFVRANAIDFGSLCYVAAPPGACPGLGLFPQGADGRLLATVDNWAVGYNFSWLYHPSDDTHIGFNYRSAVQHSLSGTARFDVPPTAGPLTAGGLLFQNTSARSSITFPDVIALGMSQRIGERLTLLFDIDWTLWSHVKQLSLAFGNPLQPPIIQPLRWHDSAKFAVGVIYRVVDSTDLRAGFSYDQSPIPNEFRSADLPDSDQIMFSAGIEYRFNAQLSATVSYSYGHYMPTRMNLTLPAAGTVAGSFEHSSSAIGLQGRLQF